MTKIGDIFIFMGIGMRRKYSKNSYFSMKVNSFSMIFLSQFWFSVFKPKTKIIIFSDNYGKYEYFR